MTAAFEFFARFLKARSGLVLTPDKQYLLENRLSPLVRRAGLGSLADLADRLSRLPASDKLAVEVTEAMTTNESLFFRDKTPFELFQTTMLPELMRTRISGRRIRIWCAAASTGQEPYSLAMTIAEMGSRLAGWRIDILGTDISTEVLERARGGLYTQFEVQRGLPVQLLMKHFKQEGEYWQISPYIRSYVQYRQLNLLEDFRHLGTFDIILCRNVLIYFDSKTKTDVIDRMVRQLAPDGYFVLGSAETVVGLTTSLRPLEDKRGLYVAASAAPALKLALAAGA